MLAVEFFKYSHRNLIPVVSLFLCTLSCKESIHFCCSQSYISEVRIVIPVSHKEQRQIQANWCHQDLQLVKTEMRIQIHIVVSNLAFYSPPTRDQSFLTGPIMLTGVSSSLLLCFSFLIFLHFDLTIKHPFECYKFYASCSLLHASLASSGASYWTGLKLDKRAGFIQALSESEMYSVLSSAQMISPLTKGNTVNKGAIQGEAAILCIQMKTFNLSSPRNL